MVAHNSKVSRWVDIIDVSLSSPTVRTVGEFRREIEQWRSKTSTIQNIRVGVKGRTCSITIWYADEGEGLLFAELPDLDGLTTFIKRGLANRAKHSRRRRNYEPDLLNGAYILIVGIRYTEGNDFKELIVKYTPTLSTINEHCEQD